MFTLSVKVNAASPGTGFLKGTIPYEWFTRVNSDNSGTTPFAGAFGGQVNMSKTNEGVCRVCCSTGYGVYHGGFSSSDFKVDTTKYTYACKARTYTVTYECGDGTGTKPSNGKPTYDASFTPASNTCTAPTGHSFAGWSVSGTTSDVKAAGTSFVWQYSENKTFTAKWTPNNYTITMKRSTSSGDYATNNSSQIKVYTTYGVNAYKSSSRTSTDVLDTNGTKKLATPTNHPQYTLTYNYEDGSTSNTSANFNRSFSGYYSGTGTDATQYFTANGTITADGLTAAKAVANDSTYWYAKWGTAKVSGLPSPERSNYAFQGWYTTASGGTKIENNSTISANTTVHAHWTPIDYTLQLNAQGGKIYDSGWNQQGTTSVYTRSYNVESGSIKLPIPTASNALFGGWCTSADDANSTSKTCTYNVTFNSAANSGTVIYYAKWIHLYPITYHPDGGQCAANASVVNLVSAYPEQTWSGTQYNGVTIRSNGRGVYVFNGTVGPEQVSGGVCGLRFNIPIKEMTIPNDALIAVYNNFATEATRVMVQFYKDGTQLGGYQLNALNLYYKLSGTSGLAGKTANRISVCLYPGLELHDLTIAPAVYADGRTTPGVFVSDYVYNSNNEYHNCKPAIFSDHANNFTLQQPTKTGYSFDGWCEGSATCNSPNKNVTIARGTTTAKTYYARWTGNPHTITYKCNEQTARTVPVRYGEEYTWLTSADVCGAEDGYTLTDFVCKKGNTEIPITTAWSVTGDVICAATKTINKLTITLNKNGGVGKCGAQTSTTPGSMVCEYNGNCVLPAWDTNNCNIINSGDDTKVLIGWGTAASEPDSIYGLGKDIKDYVKTLIASASTTMTLYAQWMAPNCTVAPSNENDISATVVKTAAVNNVPKCTYSCKDGYSPDGYTSTIPTGNKVTKNVAVNQTFNAYKVSNTTIDLADKCLGRTYHVHLNPGTGATESAADYYYVYNTPKAISGTLYYYWKKEITGDGDMVAANLSTNYVVTANKPGFEFGGYWSGEDGVGTQYIHEFDVDDAGERFNDIYKNETTGNTTSNVIKLYAKWTKEGYKIKLDPNGGVLKPGVTNPISYDVDSGVINLPDASNITRAHYDFQGWCLYNEQQSSAAEATTDANCRALVSTFTPSPDNVGNKYAYAKWTPTKYTITYHTNGGTIDATGVTQVLLSEEINVYTQQYTVKSESVTLALPTRGTGTDYQFDGWYENENFTERVGGTENKITAGESDNEYHDNIILYARWKRYCGAGYYLQKDSSEMCTECEAGYYCEAGYHFINYPEPQGLTPCSTKAKGHFRHSDSKKDSEHWCFAELTLDGNGGKTSANAGTFVFRAYNNGPAGSLSCTQYTEGGEDYPVCISPYDLTNFEYTLHPNVINKSTPFTRSGYDFTGWCRTASCEDGNKVLNTTKLEGDNTLYAQWELTKYPIKYFDVFVDDEGNLSDPAPRSVSDVNQSTYTIETTFDFVSPTKPQNNNTLGWNFEGWYDNQGLTGNAINKFVPDLDRLGEEIAYYAKWVPRIARVNFICDSETIFPRDGQVGSYIDVVDCGQGGDLGWSCLGYPEFNEQLTQLKVPEGGTDCRPGYMINYLGDGIVHNVIVDRDPQVKLVPDSYTSNLAVIFPDKKFMNNYKLRKGYSFEGWFYNYDSVTKAFSNKTTGIARGSSGHKTVYAQWSPNNYRVTYGCDSTTEGSVTPSSVSVTYDEQFTTAENTCIKTGYDFAGWMVSETDDIKQADVAFQWKYDEDKTFVAKWNPITYKVVFKGNGATSGFMGDQSFVYDVEQPLAENQFRWDNHKFVGWCDNRNPETQNCIGKLYSDKDSVSNLTSTNNTTIELYAMWALQDYTITYKVLKNDGEWQVKSGLTPSKYTTESTSALPTSISTTRPGYKFVGWCIEDSYEHPDCTLVNMDNLKNDVRDDVSLYAKWEIIKYNIEYYGYYFDGVAWQVVGLTSVEPKYSEYDINSGSKTLLKLDDNDETGEVFQGWCVSVNAYNDPTCAAITKFTPAPNNLRDIKLYAKWGYKITYELNDGTGATESDTYNYGIGLSDLLNPTRSGYTFAGWYEDAELSDKVESISDTEWGPITLYAKWNYDCDGKWMHVGDGENDKMCLSRNRPEGTDAVLGIMVDNVPYFVGLSERGNNSKTISENSDTKLHVQVGATVYNAHDASVE